MILSNDAAFMFLPCLPQDYYGKSVGCEGYRVVRVTVEEEG